MGKIFKPEHVSHGVMFVIFLNSVLTLSSALPPLYISNKKKQSKNPYLMRWLVGKKN